MKTNPNSQAQTPNSDDSRAAQIRVPKPDTARHRLAPIGRPLSAIRDWQSRLLRCASALLLATAVLVGTQNVRAVVNDNFTSALPISSIPYTNNSSNADATREPGEPYHYGSTNGHSVWWTWTALSSGPMLINCTGSSIRSVVGIYTGTSVSNLTAVSSGRGNHIVDFVAVAGTTYQIALDSLDAGIYGNFTFRLMPGVPPPVNDAFTNATVITGDSYLISYFSNAGATKEPGEPTHAGDLGGKSVWWKWTAPVAGPFQLETTGSTFDTLLAVYTGSAVTNLSVVASNDNYSGQTSLVTFNALAGTDYWFAVDGWAGKEGLIALKLSPPYNDFFTNATVITLTGNYFGANGVYNTSATKEAGEPNHAGNVGGKSLWWKWTPPGNGSCHVDTIGSAFDTLLAVYTGSSVGSLTEVASNDNSPTMPPASELAFNAVGGTAYNTAVDGKNGANGWITMNLIFIPEVPLHFEGLRGASTNAQTWFQFQLLGPAGSTAVVQTVSSLNSTNWIPVVTNVLTSSPWTVTVVNPATNAQRFFRAFLVK
jgi:hypothetical protein